jgi:uracil-DNA glycosylase
MALKVGQVESKNEPTMETDKIKLEPSWKKALVAEFQDPYMGNLRKFLSAEAKQGKKIFPRGPDIFRAFELTPLNKVKVVILGQDPYHGAGQAHGLSFSVQEGTRLPPSLQNIFKELSSDLGVSIPKTGDLSPWAKQGVLLLNSVLTVEEGKAASHRKRGWEKFTDKVIQVLSDREDPMVFILWGAFAIGKAPMIRVPPHAILKSVHPSPLSAHGGFFGSKPFSRANALLKSWGKKEIDWCL